MKTWSWAAVAALALSFSGVEALAQAAQPKVGYVDMSRAFKEVDDSKDAQAKLKRDFEGKQKQLDELQNKLKAKKDEFDAKAGMMKPEAKEQRQQELQKELFELQQTYMKLQQDLSKREGQLVQEIAKKIRRVVEKIGDREGYAMILDIGDTVLYYKRDRDVTDQVIREYNTEYAKK